MNERGLDFYKSLNYKILVDFSAEDECWYARIPELWDTLVDAKTPAKALQKAFGLKDEILELAYKEDRDIPLPRPDIEYSGRFLLRVPKTLHAKLASEAEREGTSINRLAIQFLSTELERRQTLRTVSDEIKSAFHVVLTTQFNYRALLGGTMRRVLEVGQTWKRSSVRGVTTGIVFQRGTTPLLEEEDRDNLIDIEPSGRVTT